MTLHDDEIPIDTDLVRALLEAQYPQYAGLPLRRMQLTGSTNALFRLGEDLLLRLPLQPGNGSALERERHWADVFRPRLGVAVPRTVAVGHPDLGYPEAWSILGWLPGERPATHRPDDPADPAEHRLAGDLADVILAIRGTPLTDEAVRDHRLRSYRGRSLTEHDSAVRRYLADCRANPDIDLDLDQAVAVWEDALRLPGADRPGSDHWYHGDLVAENLLINDGRLSAVIDFNVSVGDPTIDLHGAWELFGPTARDAFRERLGVDEATWLRGRAWALAIALGTFSYYWHTLPARRSDRLAMARNVLADA
ncbi:phosphotransferase [Microlunatus sp. Gsoil 973]|uniref:phosphotransferase n=1 Tax=Microlunatus sp. Gsoil 973 TaxID=2672569 RepID=UPI0012B441BF|nr:phosphotransferase [Microlunatus sp. Gsoil 973]QGN33692.1 phosphotransferase [Microlunatus sp. Gsoil 973]